MRTVRIINSILLVLLIYFVVSWHLKIFFLYLLFLIWKAFLLRDVPKKTMYSWCVFILFLLIFWLIFPNRKPRKSDHIQSIYFNKNTKKIVAEPVIPYLTNVIGEGDIMVASAIAAKLIPLKCVKPAIPPVKDVLRYMKRTPVSKDNFCEAYRKLSWKGKPPHDVPFQILKGYGWYKDLDHYFLHIPKNKDLRDCGIVVFCHGYAGNWLLFPELFSEYTDAIVIAVETPDFNGIFTKNIMQHIITQVIPHAYKRIGIEQRKPHLIGISNGGSAVNNAIRYFPHAFQSFTILSATLHALPPRGAKVHIIYGEKDRSGGVESNIPVDRYVKHVIKGEDHALLVSRPEVVFGIVNRYIQDD